MSPAAILHEINRERTTQISKGMDVHHCDGLRGNAALMGISFAARAMNELSIAASAWPNDDEMPEPGNDRRDLVIAAALIVAEIERIDRVASS